MMNRYLRVERPVWLTMLAVSLSANVLLGYAVRNPRSPIDTLTAGMVAPPLALKTLAGQPATIDFSSAPQGTILYFMSGTCGWCERNAPIVAALAAQVKDKYRLIGIASDGEGLQTYANDKGPFQLFIMKPELRLGYRVNGLPQTTVINRRGLIQQSWVGAYDGSVKRNVESFFRVSLPAIAAR
jgi:hypothetical protein